MHLKIENTFNVDTHPTKRLMVQGITKDLTIEACIFDLIDNAIDAANQTQLKGLRADYKDYEINLTFDHTSFSIEDQGSGISRQKLENSALRFGTIEHHGAGIGAFGVGLNRALFKLGKQFKITTETQTERSVFDLNVSDYLLDDKKWHIPSTAEPVTGLNGTLITISPLNEEIAEQFSDSFWTDEFLKQLSYRYSRFIRKGLVLKVNKNILHQSEVTIRLDGDFKILEKKYEKSGVKIHIKSGQHSKHRFSYEDGHIKKVNTPLTNEYGWTVFCNDRAVLIADKTSQTGWDSDFHNQHYGFSGEIHFTGDSVKLPWNTNKTGVDQNNSLYAEVLQVTRQFSEVWRSHTKKVKDSKFLKMDQASLLPQTPHNNSLNDQRDGFGKDGSSKNSDEGGQTSTALSSNLIQSGIENNHTKHNAPINPLDWKYLFGDSATARLEFKVPSSEIKLSAVIDQIRTLELDKYSFAVSLLLRVLIELSCKYYRKTNNGSPNYSENESLANKVSKCTDSMFGNHILTDKNQISSIKALCAPRGESVLSIEYLQSSIHSDTSIYPPKSVLAFWYDIQPFIRACFVNKS